MLKLTGITHCYGTHRVLDGMDLAVAPGQRIAIMGPSGCGKTTLLRIALGLLEPVEGTVDGVQEEKTEEVVGLLENKNDENENK